MTRYGLQALLWLVFLTGAISACATGGGQPVSTNSILVAKGNVITVTSSKAVEEKHTIRVLSVLLQNSVRTAEGVGGDRITIAVDDVQHELGSAQAVAVQFSTGTVFVTFTSRTDMVMEKILVSAPGYNEITFTLQEAQ